MLPPSIGSQPTRFTIHTLDRSIILSSNDPKRYERFTHLVPPRFIGAVDKDDYEFFINCLEKLHNLGLLESHGVSYTTYIAERCC